MSVTILKTEPKARHVLTPKQAQALPLVLAGKSGVEVAKEVGVAPQTVSEWLNKSQNFRQALSTERDAALDRARRVLEASVVDAALALRETAINGVGSANRTKAAHLILDKAGIVGPTEGGMSAAGVDSQTQALVALIQARRAEKELEEATA